MEFNSMHNEAKKYGLVTEWRLREWLKTGELEKLGYFAGNRFYVNHDALVEWLKSKTSGTAAE